MALLFIPVIRKLMVETHGKKDVEIAEEYKILDDEFGFSKKQVVELQTELL